MRQALKPILFDDHDKPDADAARTSIVAEAKRSKAADRKAGTKRTDDGLPVHSFRSLFGDLASVPCNTMAMVGSPDNESQAILTDQAPSRSPKASPLNRCFSRS
jgi:hypothetical protein